MSVRGEFARTVGDAVACLSESDSVAASARATQLEGYLRLAREDLEAAAAALIEHWEAPAAPDLSEATQARFADVSGRMLAIARVILGR